jgi:aminopeptidase N
VPGQFTLQIENYISPAANTKLEGLYLSSGNFCTQCEPEGFRRITYFIDRPDVLSEYTVTLNASVTDCPVLLSNGNMLSTETLPNGRHQVTWHDPHPKPSYLFALVEEIWGLSRIVSQPQVVGMFDCESTLLNETSDSAVTRWMH